MPPFLHTIEWHGFVPVLVTRVRGVARRAIACADLRTAERLLAAASGALDLMPLLSTSDSYRVATGEAR